MYLDMVWIAVGSIALVWAAYKIGHKAGYSNGYDAYDHEIAAMEQKGDVIFPGRDENS